MTAWIIDIVGWAGVVLVLVAYVLASARYLEADSTSYQVLNILGAGMLVVNSIYLEAYPSVGVNAAWVGIALIALFRAWWKGPVEAYKKVSASFAKRISLRKSFLKHLKIPGKQKHENPLKLPNVLGNFQGKGIANQRTGSG